MTSLLGMVFNFFFLNVSSLCLELPGTWYLCGGNEQIFLNFFGIFQPSNSLSRHWILVFRIKGSLAARKLKKQVLKSIPK